MEVIYRLYRKSGHLFFNSFSDEEMYWVAVQAAAQGGGSMYANITKNEFEEVFEERREVNTFKERFNRSWSPEIEECTEKEFNIRKAIDVHDLKQYAPIVSPGERFVPRKEAIKSIVTANK
jgi:hypothetical protein